MITSVVDNIDSGVDNTIIPSLVTIESVVDEIENCVLTINSTVDLIENCCATSLSVVDLLENCVLTINSTVDHIDNDIDGTIIPCLTTVESGVDIIELQVLNLTSELTTVSAQTSNIQTVQVQESDSAIPVATYRAFTTEAQINAQDKSVISWLKTILSAVLNIIFSSWPKRMAAYK